MRSFAKLAGRLLIVGAALGLGACSSVGNMAHNATQDDGATPGTVPGHVGAPGGVMDNGLLPEPWGSTS